MSVKISLNSTPNKLSLTHFGIRSVFKENAACYRGLSASMLGPVNIAFIHLVVALIPAHIRAKERLLVV